MVIVTRVRFSLGPLKKDIMKHFSEGNQEEEYDSMVEYEKHIPSHFSDN